MVLATISTTIFNKVHGSKGGCERSERCPENATRKILPYTANAYTAIIIAM